MIFVALTRTKFGPHGIFGTIFPSWALDRNKSIERAASSDHCVVETLRRALASEIETL
jgi:hypothetical protein